VTTGSETRAAIGQRISSAIARRAEGDLDPALVDAVRMRLLHAVGVAVVGTNFEPYAVAARAFDPRAGETPLLAARGSYAPADAAFVNAVAAHSSLQEDCGPGGFEEGSHPGTYIVPAALAAAHVTHCTGERLIRALIAGYEAVGIIGRLAPGGLGRRRFRPVGVMGPFGAAAAVSTIFGDDPGTLAVAIGIASNVGGGTGQGFVSGTTEPYLHAGFGARNGYLAAALAHGGATVSEDALDGDFGFFSVYAGEAPRTVSPSDEAAITRLGSKKYAVCLQNQETLEIALELAPLIHGRVVESVTLSRPATSGNGLASPGVASTGPYATMLQRQMSARFSAAAALLGRQVDDPRYFAAADSDPDVADLADRVELATSETDVVEVEVRLKGTAEVLRIAGRREQILFPRPDEVRERFISRVSSVVGSGPATEALSIVETLPEIADAAVLTDVLAGTE
jgi:2-methylcitrate dehydratase PrpD